MMKYTPLTRMEKKPIAAAQRAAARAGSTRADATPGELFNRSAAT